jgi:hypothetical protein
MSKKFFFIVIQSLILANLLLTLTGCNTQINTSSIPPYSQFTVPAVGTPMPGGREQLKVFTLPENSGGALFVNRSAAPVHVVVNDTIVEIQGGHDFLFILPPASYNFYIYETDTAPRIFTDKIDIGKTRYIYLLARLPG